ncbi:MAG: SEC-C domain-containing protein [Clostridiales bacterium]|jgi:hypothetical protein|nr:SEC-C domain-containing protein [Clostridiales bacterium]
MGLYENWAKRAYTPDGRPNERHWKAYRSQEREAFRRILAERTERFEGTIAALAEKYGLSETAMIGFIDGVNEVIDPAQELSSIEDGGAEVSFALDFEKLYKRMVELKAEYLYTLPEWGNIFDGDTRARLFAEQKSSKTVARAEPRIGRNDPCPCGSGRKYKQCCGKAS